MARRRALALVVLLAACSGDDGDEPVDPSTTTSATVDAAAAGFCDAFGALLVGPLAEGGFDPTVPDELQAAVGITAPVVDALRRGAPPELAAAADAVADAYDRAFAVLERYGYDLARVDAEATPEEQGVLDGFGRPPVGPGNLDPYDEVEAFVADRCAPGVTIPPDLTATTSP
jgi:hypothetical protein